jgi:TetR/AcrR family acrAB operon transcriptional repressor
MARRTKEESLETRRAIIDAARDVFFEHGVTSTSLEQIAAAAGVTRGAIYWHFADKVALFYAMRDEVKIPLVDRSDEALAHAGDLDPLQRIECFLRVILDQIFKDEATRKTFQIMTFKCEYVGEFARDLSLSTKMHCDLHGKLGAIYRAARRQGILRESVTPTSAASDTLIFVSGLIRLFAVDGDGALIRRDAERLVSDHVSGKRAGPAPARPRAKKRPQSIRSDVKKVSIA